MRRALLLAAAVACLPLAVAAQVIYPPNLGAQASPVTSVNGQTGDVSVPTYTDAQAKAAAQTITSFNAPTVLSPTMTGTATLNGSPISTAATEATLLAAYLPVATAASTYQPIGAYALSSALGGYLTTAAAPGVVVANAPVQSVNGATGAVSVPGTIRASCSITSFNASAVGSCSYGGFTGGTAFTSTPDCFAELTATNTNYVYSFPIVARAQTSATATMFAALKVLNIALGVTTVWATPPSGTTLTIICRGQ